MNDSKNTIIQRLYFLLTKNNCKDSNVEYKKNSIQIDIDLLELKRSELRKKLLYYSRNNNECANTASCLADCESKIKALKNKLNNL